MELKMLSIQDINQKLTSGLVWTGFKDEHKIYQNGEIAYDKNSNSTHVYLDDTWVQINDPDSEITPELPEHIQAQIRLMYPGYDIILRKTV
jgi:hypothetical protein